MWLELSVYYLTIDSKPLSLRRTILGRKVQMSSSNKPAVTADPTQISFSGILECYGCTGTRERADQVPTSARHWRNTEAWPLGKAECGEGFTV